MQNSRSRFVISLILVFGLLLTFMVGGCSSGVSSERGKTSSTITVTDGIGREVAVPKNSQRIACLCPDSGHAIAMFGHGKKIVAAVEGMRRDKLLVQMYPHIKDLPVPKTSGAINIEELAACQPDLVFVKSEIASNQAEVDKLNKIGIPFLVVEYNSMAEQQDFIAMMGQVLGEAELAQKYTGFYQQSIERVADRIADIPEEERVKIYHSINEATRTDTPGTLPADWTNAAGANNVSINQKLKLYDGQYYASVEQILSWDPDVILVNDANVVVYIMNHEQWKPLAAVKNKRVLALPNGISRWGHFSSLETPLALMWTAKTLYPDRFADNNIEDQTKYFYKEFFRMDLSDEMIERILTGKGMRESKK